MVYAAVRIRGKINVKPDIKRTLELLNLTRSNHCVILNEDPSVKGMLKVVKDYITWGEINQETLTKLIKSRGRLIGDKELTDAYIKSNTSYKDVEQLSKAILDDKIRYKDVPDVKPFFRLHPPRKGFKSIKRPVGKKGAAGYRGKDINNLLQRMI